MAAIPQGLLVRGRLEQVPGLVVLPPASAGGPAWCALDPADYCLRPSWGRVQMIVLHTTKGDPPHTVAGVGAGGRDRAVADFWRGDPAHSAAQLVVDDDGTAACLCDLALVEAYHATVSNPWSVGIEMAQAADNGVRDATYDATVRLVVALCRIFGLPLQVPRLPYSGHPMRRMLDGGRQVWGVVGHRDNTERRGAGDPGDEIFERLVAAGAERLIDDAGTDLARWRARQQFLNDRHGAGLAVDGLPGPATMAAVSAAGYARPADMPA